MGAHPARPSFGAAGVGQCEWMPGMERAARPATSLLRPDVAVRGADDRGRAWVVSPRLLVAQAVVAALTSVGVDVELHAWESLAIDAFTNAGSGSPQHVIVVLDEFDGAKEVNRISRIVGVGDVRVAVVVPGTAPTWWIPLLDESAVDVVTTATSLDELVDMVARFAAGERLLPTETREALRAGWAAALDKHRQVVSLVRTLTPTQLRVLELLADGHRVREIARLMGVADGTVRTHVRALRAKLGARTQIEAVAMLRQVDLDTPGAPGAGDARGF